MQASNNFYDDEIRLKDVILKIQALKGELFSRWKVIFIVSSLFALIGVICNKKTSYL